MNPILLLVGAAAGRDPATGATNGGPASPAVCDSYCTHHLLDQPVHDAAPPRPRLSELALPVISSNSMHDLLKDVDGLISMLVLKLIFGGLSWSIKYYL